MDMEAKLERLLSIKEGMSVVGLKSETSYRKLIAQGALPPLIRRGRNVYHLASDLQAYVAALTKNREAS